MLRNTVAAYGRVARWLHWLTAACMLPTLAIAVYVDTLDEHVPGDPQRYFAWMPWHKTLGFLVLCFIVLRLPWALANVRPALPGHMSRLQQALARVAHVSLYGLMLALPILGWLGTSALQSTFKLFTLWRVPPLLSAKDEALSKLMYEWHVILGWTALGLVGLHIAAVAWHQWVARDDLFARMGLWRWGRRRQPEQRGPG